MQYITQCPRYPRVITTRSRKNNYLLSQIVKEQPMCHFANFRRNTNQPRSREKLIAGSSSTQMLVEPTGIEPVTSCLQSRRSPS